MTDSLNLPIDLSGIVHVSGLKGVGKSHFAWSVSNNPKKVAVLDFERSLADVNSQVLFGAYHDIVGTAGVLATNEDWYQAVVKAAKSLQHNLYDVIILDNIEPLENCLEGRIQDNPEKFGMTKAYVEKTQFWRGKATEEYRKILSDLAAKCKLLIITSHLKQTWAAAKPIPGRYEIRGRRLLREMTGLCIMLKREKRDWPPPSGLVLWSRLNKVTYTDTGPVVVPVLPPRIPKCDWNSIREYMREPFGSREPWASEFPDRDGWGMITNSLTEEQKEFYRMALEELKLTSGWATEESEEGEPKTIVEFIQAVTASGMDLAGALAKLGVKSATDIKDYGLAMSTLGL